MGSTLSCGFGPAGSLRTKLSGSVDDLPKLSNGFVDSFLGLRLGLGCLFPELLTYFLLTHVLFDSLLLRFFSLVKVCHLVVRVLLLHLGHDLLGHQLVELLSIQSHLCLSADLRWALGSFAQAEHSKSITLVTHFDYLRGEIASASGLEVQFRFFQVLSDLIHGFLVLLGESTHCSLGASLHPLTNGGGIGLHLL